MRNSKKRRSGATPEEVLLLIARAEEKIAKQTKKSTETENHETGHQNVSNRMEDKGISSTAVQKKAIEKNKNHDKNKTRTNKKTKEKTQKRQGKKIKNKSNNNIKRGATAEEMLQMIAKAKERMAKADKEKSSIENIFIAKTEELPTTEGKKLQIPEAPAAEKKRTFNRTFLNLFRPETTITKVALFFILTTLSVTALTFGLSIINFPSVSILDALTPPKQARTVTIDFNANKAKILDEILKLPSTRPQKAILTVVNTHNQGNRNGQILLTEGNTKLVESNDNNRFEINHGSYTSFDFSDISIPTDASIKSVVVYIEHFEEKQFVQGQLEWTIGTGWPESPDVWASIQAPVQNGRFNEAVDSWDITSLVDSSEKINSLQLQVENIN
jgi:hypothetical protein